ncbi:unnamed protein product, partial [Rotaria sp. Silwood2]
NRIGISSVSKSAIVIADGGFVVVADNSLAID